MIPLTKTIVSPSTLLLLGLLFLATLQTSVFAAPLQSPNDIDSPLAPRDGPPPATKVPPGRTNPASRINPLLKSIIDKLKEEVGEGEPPVVEEVQVDEEVEYPPRAEAKIKKKKEAEAKNQEQNCALEYCDPRAEVCVHMAGREFWNRYFTCCPEGQFADFDGYCCDMWLGGASPNGVLCPKNPNHKQSR